MDTFFESGSQQIVINSLSDLPEVVKKKNLLQLFPPFLPPVNGVCVGVRARNHAP